MVGSSYVPNTFFAVVAQPYGFRSWSLESLQIAFGGAGLLAVALIGRLIDRSPDVALVVAVPGLAVVFGVVADRGAAKWAGHSGDGLGDVRPRVPDRHHCRLVAGRGRARRTGPAVAAEVLTGWTCARRGGAAWPDAFPRPSPARCYPPPLTAAAQGTYSLLMNKELRVPCEPR